MELALMALCIIPALTGMALFLKRGDASEGSTTKLSQVAVFLLWGCFSVITSLYWRSSEKSLLVHFGSLGETLPLHFSFLLTRVNLLFLSITLIFVSIVLKVARTYLHREVGFHRFFALMFCFTCGMILLTLSENLTLFLMGWELIGFASVMLIAFYRNRFAPVSQALKTLMIYKISDLFLLVAFWVAAILLRREFSFASLEQFPTTSSLHFWLGLCIIVASLAKSAQFPFCSWLPRAMEGPTPSSAIFYGALSVHAGIFLLLKTFDLWSFHAVLRSAVFAVGGLSFFLGTISGRVQTNIKAQIAYATIAQVGIMYIELSLGFTALTFFHLVTHACLRCYQILVSPSVVVDTLSHQDQLWRRGGAIKKSFESRLPVKIQALLFSFAFREGFLPEMHHFFFRLAEKLSLSRFFQSPQRFWATISALWLLPFIAKPLFAEQAFSALTWGLVLSFVLAILSLGVLRDDRPTLLTSLVVALGAGFPISQGFFLPDFFMHDIEAKNYVFVILSLTSFCVASYLSLSRWLHLTFERSGGGAWGRISLKSIPEDLVHTFEKTHGQNLQARRTEAFSR